MASLATDFAFIDAMFASLNSIEGVMIFIGIFHRLIIEASNIMMEKKGGLLTAFLNYLPKIKGCNLFLRVE